MQMELLMKENGLKINNKEREKKLGMMVQDIKVTMQMVKKKDRDNLIGKMAVHI